MTCLYALCPTHPSTHPAEVSSLSSGWEEGGLGAAPAASLAPLLAGLGKAGQAWGDRVALFQSVQAALQQSGASAAAAADVTSNADRLVAALLEGCGDAHFRVAAAALTALGTGLSGPCSRLFEPQLDRIMTLLFARWADGLLGVGTGGQAFDLKLSVGWLLVGAWLAHWSVAREVTTLLHRLPVPLSSL